LETLGKEILYHAENTADGFGDNTQKAVLLPMTFFVNPLARPLMLLLNHHQDWQSPHEQVAAVMLLAHDRE